MLIYKYTVVVNILYSLGSVRKKSLMFTNAVKITIFFFKIFYVINPVMAKLNFQQPFLQSSVS